MESHPANQVQNPIQDKQNLTLEGAEADRFEHLNVGDVTPADIQLKVMEKDYHYDDDGTKTCTIRFFADQAFPKNDIESKMEGKVF